MRQAAASKQQQQELTFQGVAAGWESLGGGAFAVEQAAALGMHAAARAAAA